MRTAIIEDKTGLVATVVDVDLANGYDPGPGFSARDVSSLEVTGGWVWDGRKFIGPAGGTETEADLDTLRPAATAQIDKAAENARRKYLTDGMGQAITYQAKADEIRRYDADTNPVKADYPFLSAEIGITGSSLSAVADAVRGAVAAWSTYGPEIERVRLKAKADIAKATSPATIQDIVSAIEWP